MSPGEQGVGQLFSQGGVRPDPAAGRVLRLRDPEELRDELALGGAVLPLGLGPDEVALRVPAQTWVALRTPIRKSTLHLKSLYLYTRILIVK